MSLTKLTVGELASGLAAADFSSVEVTEAHLDRIEALDSRIRSFLRSTPELALEQARAADRRLRAGSRDALTGVPFAVKDVLCVEGVEITAGSRILEGFRPFYTATAVRRLLERGGVLLGVTNCDEFAMGSSTENSAYFTTANPWDLERVPGGSSGGSAAAVAAGFAPYSLGTDTGGSIRQPAALCGIVGLKPTYGRVSRWGLIAFASSLDQIGPFTRSVADAGLVLQAIAGRDERDSTSVPVPADGLLERLEDGLRGLRIGLPVEYFDAPGTEPGVMEAVRRAVQAMERAGAELVEVSLPHTDYGLAAYYIIAPAEASSNLARFDGVRYGLSHRAPGLLETYLETRGAGFGPEVRRRIMLGTYALSAGYYDAYYLKAQKVRTLIKRDFDLAFERCDVIAGPTSPQVAFPIGAKTGDPLSMYLCDVFTLGANLAGLPGVSLPCGLSEGLPVGLQLVAQAFDEAGLLRAARGYELASGITAVVAGGD